MKHRLDILILCIIFGVGIVAILGGMILYTNAGAPTMTPTTDRTQNSPAELLTSVEEIPSGVPTYDLSLSTVDVSTGEPLGNVSVYLDGGYVGFTSTRGTMGVLNISPVPEGQHTIRVTKYGYTDYTQRVPVPSPAPVKIGMQAHLLVTVQEPGSHNEKIDIVFIPSGTSYSCTEREKMYSTGYVTDKNLFVSDVNRIVHESLFTLDLVTDNTDPIPADYRDRFNIYYYYDSSEFADAFDGYAGTVPENVWKTAPFADIVIILYPAYYGPDTGVPCEPNGGVHPGTGRSWMKTSAHEDVLFLHESGHAIFGLIDTYCGSTEYWQNNPDPNVWSSQESCTVDATTNAWDPSACRQIQQVNPVACTKQFWRWDPDPDIMHDGYSGTFGKASTRRIAYTFNTISARGTTA